MNVGWLIDAGIFDACRDDLVEAIRSEGHSVVQVEAPRPGYTWDDAGCSYRDVFPQGSCVVVHGDIDLSLRVRCEGCWTPGAFCSVENFECSTYYLRFGERLLNPRHIMLPFAELEHRLDFLLGEIGEDGRIFVRPDSPLKLFTGQIVHSDTRADDLEVLGFYDFPRESKVVVSAPRQITEESRFLVVDRRVVAGSTYKIDGEECRIPDYDQEAVALAQEVASSDWQPDPVWVIDVCRTVDGSVHLLEIGAFSFADLYACDKSVVAREVSRAAWDVWVSENAES